MRSPIVAEPPRIRPLERVLFLKRVSWLAGLPAPDLAVVGDRAREQAWGRGAAVLRPGQPVGVIHLVVEGRLRVRRGERVLGHAGPGDAVGARLMLAADAAGLEAVAEVESLTLALDHEAFLDVLEERFAIYRGLLRQTCRELVSVFLRSPAEAAPAPPPPASSRPPGAGLDDLVERILLLRCRAPFEACSINALAELSQRLEEVRLPAGSVVWRRGDRPERMMFVASGRLRCEPAAPGGAFHLGPGQPIGTLELLGDRPRWFDLVVEEPVTALAGRAEQLLDLFEDNVDMGLAFLAHLMRLLVRLEERVAGGVPTAWAGGGEGEGG